MTRIVPPRRASNSSTASSDFSIISNSEISDTIDEQFEIIMMPNTSSESEAPLPAGGAGRRARRRQYQQRRRQRRREAEEYGTSADGGSDTDSSGDSQGTNETATATVMAEQSPVLLSLPTLPTPPSHTPANSSGAFASGAPSTYGDATSSIDSFLSDSASFMSVRANKLRLWQALCIELGLVRLQEAPSLAAALEALSMGDSIPAREHRTPASSGTGTPTSVSAETPKATHPLPQSLTAARNLLKAEAHLNLVDYLKAREKRGHLPQEGRYKDLLFPSVGAVIRDTIKKRRYVKLGDAKGEWLEPLLKDFGFKAARQRSAA